MSILAFILLLFLKLMAWPYDLLDSTEADTQRRRRLTDSAATLILFGWGLWLSTWFPVNRCWALCWSCRASWTAVGLPSTHRMLRSPTVGDQGSAIYSHTARVFAPQLSSSMAVAHVSHPHSRSITSLNKEHRVDVRTVQTSLGLTAALLGLVAFLVWCGRCSQRRPVTQYQPSSSPLALCAVISHPKDDGEYSGTGQSQPGDGPQGTKVPLHFEDTEFFDIPGIPEKRNMQEMPKHGNAEGDRRWAEGEEGSAEGEQGRFEGDEGSFEGDQGSCERQPGSSEREQGSSEGQRGSSGGQRGSVEKLVHIYRDLAEEDAKLADHSFEHGRCSTPLHLIAGNVNSGEAELAAVAFLLQSGASVDSPSKRESLTPLHAAAYSGNVKIAAYLLDHGASLYAATEPEGYTPLHFAALFSQLDILMLLADTAERKRDFSVFHTCNRSGLLPVHIAEDELQKLLDRLPPGSAHWGVWNVLDDITFHGGGCWRDEGPFPGAQPRSDKEYWVSLLEQAPDGRCCLDKAWFDQAFEDSGRKTFFPIEWTLPAERRRRQHHLPPHQIVFITNAQRTGFVVIQTNSQPCDMFHLLTRRQSLLRKCRCTSCTDCRRRARPPPSVWVRFVWVRPEARGSAALFALMRRLKTYLGGDLSCCWCEMDPRHTGIAVEKWRPYLSSQPYRRFKLFLGKHHLITVYRFF